MCLIGTVVAATLELRIATTHFVDGRLAVGLLCRKPCGSMEKYNILLLDVGSRYFNTLAHQEHTTPSNNYSTIPLRVSGNYLYQLLANNNIQNEK